MRRKEFLLRFWGTFLTVLALPSAVLTILGKHISVNLTGGLIVFALTFAVILNRKRLIAKTLPGVPAFEHERLHCPCDLKLTEQAGRLAQECFRGENISPTKYQALHVKNPNILACLTGAQGDFLGYFDVIPLKNNFGELFFQGRVTEKDITHEDILTPSEVTQCRYLYISGLAVSDCESYAAHTNAFVLIWGLLKYLNHFYGKTTALTFAVAFTKEGENLLRKFGLQVGTDAAARVDKHTAYSIALSAKEIAQRLSWMPDYSSICSLDWVPNEAATPSPDPAASPRREFGRHRLPLPSRNIRSLASPISRATRHI